MPTGRPQAIVKVQPGAMATAATAAAAAGFRFLCITAGAWAAKLLLMGMTAEVGGLAGMTASGGCMGGRSARLAMKPPSAADGRAPAPDTGGLQESRTSVVCVSPSLLAWKITVRPNLGTLVEHEAVEPNSHRPAAP